DRAALVIGADELHQQLGAEDLHRIGDRQPGLPQPTQHVELGARPLPGRDLPAEGGAPGDRPGLAGVLSPPALGVGVAAVERRMLGGAVALGDQQHLLARRAGALLERQGALDAEGVGLLAGLADRELGVDRPVVLDHPVGAGLRAAIEHVGGLGPRGPALVVVALGEGEGVHGLREEGVPVEGRGHGGLLREGLRDAQQAGTEGRTAGVSTATTISSSFPQGSTRNRGHRTAGAAAGASEYSAGRADAGAAHWRACSWRTSASTPWTRSGWAATGRRRSAPPPSPRRPASSRPAWTSTGPPTSTCASPRCPLRTGPRSGCISTCGAGRGRPRWPSTCAVSARATSTSVRGRCPGRCSPTWREEPSAMWRRGQ